MPIVHITTLDHPGVEIFSTLTEAQLRRKVEPSQGIFIAESPKVIRVALDAGYTPVALLCEERHIEGDAADIVERCGNIPLTPVLANSWLNSQAIPSLVVSFAPCAVLPPFRWQNSHAMPSG